MPARKILDAASATLCVNIAANITNGQVAGNNTALDNSSDKYPRAKATLYVSAFNSAPTADNVVELWMIRQDVAGGTNDDTAGGSVNSTPATPSNGFASTQGAELVTTFPVAQTTSAQRITRDFSLGGALKALFFIRNQTGQQINAGSGTECTVHVHPYTEEIA